MKKEDFNIFFKEFPLEEPVKNAVLTVFMAGENTGSSGFHHFHPKPRWGIVFNGRASDRVVSSAIETGLAVEYRQHRNSPPDEWFTDITLPGVAESEPDKAKEVFDRFAEIYVKQTSVD
jgi:hypothetical protein